MEKWLGTLLTRLEEDVTLLGIALSSQTPPAEIKDGTDFVNAEVYRHLRKLKEELSFRLQELRDVSDSAVEIDVISNFCENMFKSGITSYVLPAVKER